MSPCPNCGDADGSNRCGHQVHGVYDGTLYWSCFACGHVWPRDFGDWERLNKAAREAVEEVQRDRRRT